MTRFRGSPRRGAGVAIACANALLLTLTGYGGVSLAVKQVAAPPEDILTGVVRLPDPLGTPTRSRAAWLPLAGDGELSVPVAAGPLRVLVLAPKAERLELALETSDGSRTVLGANPAAGTKGVVTRIQEVAPGSGEIAVLHELPWVAAGECRVRVSPTSARGMLLITSAEEEVLNAALGSHELVSGATVPVVAWLSDTNGAAPHGGSLTRCHVAVEDADGARNLIELRPMPGDSRGAWRGEVRLGSPGPCRLTLDAEGVAGNGLRLLRGASIGCDVASPAWVGTPVSAGLGNSAIVVRVPIADPIAGRRLLLAAEVWSGEAPVCWLSEIGVPSGTHGSLSLHLDPRWLARAGVKDASRLELRRIRLHDLACGVVLDEVDQAPIPEVRAITEPAALPVTIPPLEPGFAPDRAMLMGRPSAAPMVEAPSAPPGERESIGGNMASHVLMLVHGYCADDMPFPLTPFTGNVELFEDFNQSRSTDDFAVLVGVFGLKQKSHGIVAHSHGGMAALHLYTYYWSGLDWAGPGRLIQTVGTPYQGTFLAGNLALIGQIFGVGCGVNNSLTYSGAAAWLSTIPSWARSEVFYWTAGFMDFPGTYDYCSIFTDPVLTDPEDGVTEDWAGQLGGGHNMGYTAGWCHIDGMLDPPECTDWFRNTEMNANAAR